MTIIKHLKTAHMSAQNKTNGGMAYLFPGYVLKIIHLVPMLLLWRTLISSGVDVGMTLAQMLTYTYLGVILSEMLVVRTQASNWLYEGLFISLYQRPVNVAGHLISQTIGGWAPQLALFSLPLLIAAPFLGISLEMHSLWFLPSLFLCITLGFAVDFLFACLIIRLRNASWLVHVIKMAVVSLFSGSVIPFSVLPWGIGTVLQYTPFGSLAGAPLSVFTGISEPLSIIVTQLLWNMALWPLAVAALEKSRERMVSYGG